jgi:hypothetical protein
VVRYYRNATHELLRNSTATLLWKRYGVHRPCYQGKSNITIWSPPKCVQSLFQGELQGAENGRHIIVLQKLVPVTEEWTSGGVHDLWGVKTVTVSRDQRPIISDSLSMYQSNSNDLCYPVSSRVVSYLLFLYRFQWLDSSWGTLPASLCEVWEPFFDSW